jgi:DNA polymerase I
LTKAFIVDGNYYLWRAFSVSARTRNINHIEKNTLSLFLTFVCNDALLLKATHILVVFDAKRSWRHDIYKEYKANRNKGANEVTTSTGQMVVLDITAGSLVKKAKQVCELAGLPVAQKKGYEGDDLLASAATSIPGKVVLGTRDKDCHAPITEDGRVQVWWPSEKQMMDWKAVIKKFGVRPDQIAAYLALSGDAADNIPGIPNVAHGTASKWLKEHSTLQDMLKDPKILAKLKPHKATLVMCKRLTTLKDDVVFKIEDLVPQPIDHSLKEHVWSIPPALRELSDARKFANKRGLFGK